MLRSPPSCPSYCTLGTAQGKEKIDGRELNGKDLQQSGAELARGMPHILPYETPQSTFMVLFGLQYDHLVYDKNDPPSEVYDLVVACIVLVHAETT